MSASINNCDVIDVEKSQMKQIAKMFNNSKTYSMKYSTNSKHNRYSAVAEEGRLGYGKDLLPSQVDTLDQSTIKLIKAMSYGEIIS